MGKVELSQAELVDCVIRLQEEVELLQGRNQAQQLVLSWLLFQQPKGEALRFLSRQANELDGHPKCLGELELLDELRELLLRLHSVA